MTKVYVKINAAKVKLRGLGKPLRLMKTITGNISHSSNIY